MLDARSLGIYNANKFQATRLIGLIVLGASPIAFTGAVSAFDKQSGFNSDNLLTYFKRASLNRQYASVPFNLSLSKAKLKAACPLLSLTEPSATAASRASTVLGIPRSAAVNNDVLPPSSRVSTVRRQGFWVQWQLKLR